MLNNYILKESAYYQEYFVDIKADPFVKWAGGKRQIIDKIHSFIPSFIMENDITYIEPFVGGGAVFFSLFRSTNIKQAILIDNNPTLIITYKIIKNQIKSLVDNLSILEKKYNSNDNEDFQSDFYYQIRDNFNKLIIGTNLTKENQNWIEIASFFIFLNRTCFNGLYRVNSKGEFNVPRGKYKNPKICDTNNLYRVSDALKKAKIIRGDFIESEKYINDNTFIYLDPPYRPLKSSSFNSYTKTEFNDAEQKRLADFCHLIDKLGGKFLLSNSDPKNTDPNDDFFDKLYENFNIVRINARRNINSNGNDRGNISELLIMNY